MTMHRLSHAFVGGGGQQWLERKLDIGALIGRHAARDEIEPFQSQHMIEPDRAGILHRCAQDLAERRAVGLDQLELD